MTACCQCQFVFIYAIFFLFFIYNFFFFFFFFFAGVIPHIHKSLIGKKGANKPT